MLFAIERNKLCAFRLCTYNDTMTFHHISVKTMHGLSIGHHDIIGDVDNVVHRSQADSGEFVFQPFRTFFYLAAHKTHTGIALASLCIFNAHLNRKLVAVNRESTAVRAMQTRCIPIA